MSAALAWTNIKSFDQVESDTPTKATERKKVYFQVKAKRFLSRKTKKELRNRMVQSLQK